MVKTCVAPAVVSKSATNRAVIEMRGRSFLSERADEKYGMTACTCAAEAERVMSNIINNSIKWSFTGGVSDWMIKTLRERTL